MQRVGIRGEGLAVNVWVGLLTSAKAPAAHRELLHSEVVKVLAMPDRLVERYLMQLAHLATSRPVGGPMERMLVLLAPLARSGWPSDLCWGALPRPSDFQASSQKHQQS